jgi:hypothetical protein
MPGRFSGHAPEQVAGDPLAHRGHRLVREHDQVEVVDRDLRVGQGGAHGSGVAGVWVDHHHLHPGPERRAAGGEPGLHRGAGPPVDLPQQGLLAGDVDEPGLPRIRASPPDPAIPAGAVMSAVGQPPGPAESGLVHPQHRRGLRLEEFDRAVHDDRPLHRRPRHPMRGSDFGLVPAVLDRRRERRPQPCSSAHPGWHLGDLLGERLPRTASGAAPPAPLPPLHQRELAAARQVPRAG